MGTKFEAFEKLNVTQLEINLQKKREQEIDLWYRLKKETTVHSPTHTHAHTLQNFTVFHSYTLVWKVFILKLFSAVS